MMLATIVVPLDGSPFAESALPHARRLARATGAEVVLVRCSSHPASLHGGATYAHDLAVNEALSYLYDVAQGLSYRGCRVRTAVVSGEPGTAIAEAAATHRADLIVMTTQGRKGLDRLPLDPIAESVLRHSGIPTLLVRGTHRYSYGSSEPYRRILIPLDGTRESEDVLGYIVRQKLAQAAEFVLLHTVDPGHAAVPGVLDAMPADLFLRVESEVERRLATAHRYLERLAQRYLAPQGLCWSSTVLLNDPALTILHAARAREVEVIIMAAHERSGAQRFWLGSVTETVMQQADVPVLVLHGTPVEFDRVLTVDETFITEPLVPVLEYADEQPLLFLSTYRP